MKKLGFESFSSCKISTNQLNQLSGGGCTGGGFEVKGDYWRSWESDDTRDSGTTGGILKSFYGVAYGRYNKPK